MATRRTETEIRNILGCFLFSDEDVYKKIGVLSGGERNRYALAKMLLQPSNFLLMDEPTNHLDMRAKDVLLESLMEYTGTLVFVSHDRYFIDRLATRVYEIEGGRVTVYPGNYEDYLWRKEQEAAGAIPLSGAPLNGASPAAPASAKPQKKLNPIKMKQLEDRVAEIEKTIARLEAECVELSTEMGKRPGEAGRLAVDLGGLRQRIGQLEAEWEAAAAALEEARG
jgi:ATP-binding cassette subfamily F protein 3